VKIALQIQGATEAAHLVSGLAQRLTQPATPLLSDAAALMLSSFQSHLRDQQGPDGAWPALHPVTRAIRRYYGHGETPRLIRGGDLLQSLTTLGQTDTSVEVGTRLGYAAILQTGGQVANGHTGSHGTRTVQAFPFVYLTGPEIDAILGTVTAYYFGEDGASAA
jgi:phage gpG-like protein